MASDNSKVALGAAVGVFATLAFPFIRDSIFGLARDAVTEGVLQAMDTIGQMAMEEEGEGTPAEPTVLTADIFRERAENGVAE